MHGGPSVLSPIYSVLVHWPVQPIHVGGWPTVAFGGASALVHVFAGSSGSWQELPFFLKATAGQNL